MVFSGIHEEPKVTLLEVAHSLLEKQDFLAELHKMVSDWEGNKDKLIQDRLKRTRLTISEADQRLRTK